MPETTTPHEDLAAAVRRIAAEKHPKAMDWQVHEQQGKFIGLTFGIPDRSQQPRYFYWVDPTGAMPKQPRYTREAAAAVLQPRADRAFARVTPVVLWTRPREEQVGLLREDAGDCTRCGEQLAEGMFRWTDAEPDPIFGGTGQFPSLRHADGSPGHGDDASSLFAVNACPECLQPGVTFRDTGYGWDAKCPHCGWQKYTDSGD